MSDANLGKHRLVLGLGSALMITFSVGCKSQASCTQGAVAEISGNHGHGADVPAEHVNRAVGGSYAIKGGDHEHVVSLKDADMAKLKAGEKIRTVATSVNGHTHEVEVACK